MRKESKTPKLPEICNFERGVRGENFASVFLNC